MSAAELPAEPVVSPKRRSRTAPLVGFGTLLALGAGSVTLAARPLAPTAPPQELLAPVQVAEAAPLELLPAEPHRQELMGPPRPELAGPPVPPLILARRSAPPPVVASNRGAIGHMGPIPGPLNANVAGQGPIWGPQWVQKPLPNVLGGPLALQPPPAAPKRPAPVDPGSDISSELPDERTVALSRLANPQLQVRTTAVAKSDEVSAEKPLNLNVSLKDGSFRAGESVTARVTASTPCYAALVLVDSEGKATTVFQSGRPTREFTCLLKAGPSAGPEYLLAVASVHPLGGTDLAAALRGAGTGFTAVKAGGDSGMPPATAWTHAVAHVDELDNGQRKLQRFEWATDTASFITTGATPGAERPAAKPAPSKDEPKKDEPKPEAGTKGEGSALPKPAPVDAKPEAKPAPATGDGSILPK